MSGETCIAAAVAQVMVYNDATKQWQAPPGGDGSVSRVQIMQDVRRPAFRIVSCRDSDGLSLLDFNIYQKLRYVAPNPGFHQWRDEKRRVYGLRFEQVHDAQTFQNLVGQAIDQLSRISMNSDYQQSHPVDNVYQDPHQHLQHIHSAPNFHDENQNANFRKTSQHATLSSASALSQQQRRASQSSSTSGGSTMYQHHQDMGNTSWNNSSIPPAPPISNIPQAPPAPNGTVAPIKSSGVPPPPPPPPPMGAGIVPPVSSGAPPPPPPPPPQLSAGTSLADQLKIRSQQMQKVTSNGPSTVDVEKPVAPKGGGDLMSELNAQLNKRKMTQAKSDAADSKSNTSNGSSDSGCGTATPGNGGSVGIAAAKKWPVADGAKPMDSPKAHRKLPSAASIFSQDDDSSSKTSVPLTNGPSSNAQSDLYERLRADLMVEVRLEINKAKQEIIEATKKAKQEILESIMNSSRR